MKAEIKAYYKTKFLVLVNEEYGYRSWFWFPQMSPESLESWWLKLETVEPYFMTPEPLPGIIFQVHDDDEWDLYSKLEASSKYFTAHIHCNDDSILIKPDKTKIFHKGYEE